jgi:hypothetical protein
MWKPAVHISVNFVLGMFSTMIAFALAVFLMTLYVQYRDNPLSVVLQHDGVSGPTCPGNHIESIFDVTIRRPTIVLAYFSIMDEKLERTVFTNPTAASISLHPPGSSDSFDQPVRWTVPDLPPGRYHRVNSFVSRESSTRPEWVVVPFEIVKDCE